MTTAAQWVEGARPRTLPAAVAPVVAGTGAAAAASGAVWWKALLALGVSLALQVGVNYANDYSDGVRGTDSRRVGPLRLVGSGVAAPATVKRAAWLAFGLAGALGLVLAATSGWWLLAVGAAAVLSAWLYTGGPRPYGYAGLGELFVFVFFGLVAVCGTTYVQVGRVTRTSLVCAVAVGLLACAILVANNLRDIPTDGPAGKRTLAVRLGDRRTRLLYATLMTVPALAPVALAVAGHRWALLGLVALPLQVLPARTVLAGAGGRDLIPVLRSTGRTELAFAVLVGVGLALS
ncbi:MAG: 1,4-dihydroxy-2-naphthoate polyprenyltransferase [Actinomycetes bacterium]